MLRIRRRIDLIPPACLLTLETELRHRTLVRSHLPVSHYRSALACDPITTLAARADTSSSGSSLKNPINDCGSLESNVPVYRRSPATGSRIVIFGVLLYRLNSAAMSSSVLDRKTERCCRHA